MWVGPARATKREPTTPNVPVQPSLPITRRDNPAPSSRGDGTVPAARPSRRGVYLVVGLAASALFVGGAALGLTGSSSVTTAADDGLPSPTSTAKNAPVRTAGGREQIPSCSVRGASVVATSTASDGVDEAGATVSYEAFQLIDGDQETAWRVPGRGVGESISITFPRVCRLSSLGVLNGYAKFDPFSGADRWTQNRRVSEVNWTAGGRSGVQRLDVQSRTRQSFGIQPVDVASVTMTIVDSYPAITERDFVALSEVYVS